MKCAKKYCACCGRVFWRKGKSDRPQTWGPRRYCERACYKKAQNERRTKKRREAAK